MVGKCLICEVVKDCYQDSENVNANGWNLEDWLAVEIAGLVGLGLQDPEVVDLYREHFEEIWETSQYVSSFIHIDHVVSIVQHVFLVSDSANAHQ